MGSKKLVVCHGIFFVTVFSVGAAQAGDGSTTSVTSSFANPAPVEGCLMNVGFGNMQAIKNMAQKLGPEAVLDMMFSSVNPVFQPALLTKSTGSAKSVKNIEDMRENKYFQPAIAPVSLAVPWVKVTADGRVISSRPVQTEAGFGWMRLPSANANTSEADEHKPAAITFPRRY